MLNWSGHFQWLTVSTEVGELHWSVGWSEGRSRGIVCWLHAYIASNREIRFRQTILIQRQARL